MTTRDDLAAAFTEWDRRYRLHPEQFSAEWHETATAEEYGGQAADYLLRVLRELAPAEDLDLLMRQASESIEDPDGTIADVTARLRVLLVAAGVDPTRVLLPNVEADSRSVHREG